MNKKLFIEKITKFDGWDTYYIRIRHNPHKVWLEMSGRICPVNDSCSYVTGSKCASNAKEVVTCSTFDVKLGIENDKTDLILDGKDYPGGFVFVPPRDCGNSLVAKVQSAEGLLTFVLEDLDTLYGWSNKEDIMTDSNEDSPETYKKWSV